MINILIMFPISQDQISETHLLTLYTHPLLTSKHFSLIGLASDWVSLHINPFTLILDQDRTAVWAPFGAKMIADTF